MKLVCGDSLIVLKDIEENTFDSMVTDGIVLDPFMGSGSTGIAALTKGFDFYGIEKELEYFNIADKRINNTGVLR